MSFGFRRRAAIPSTGIPVPITSSNSNCPERQQQQQQQQQLQHQRSKSLGPEHESRRRQQQQQQPSHQQANNEDDYYQANSRYQHYSSSGRSTPRLAPPKKESSGLPIRTNRFGFRSQTRYTDKVSDLGFASHLQQQKQYQQDKHSAGEYQLQPDGPAQRLRQSRSPGQPQQLKPRSSPVNQPPCYQQHYAGSHQNNNGSGTNAPGSITSLLGHNNNNNNSSSSSSSSNNNNAEGNRSGQVGKYTLHTSHLPLPQYALRLPEASTKSAKTVANQSRKIGAPGPGSSKDGSGTEDSGLGSQHGGYSDEGAGQLPGRSRYDYYSRQQQRAAPAGKPRKLDVLVSGKCFDVRDVDEEHTVTEISVIQLPANFAQQQLQRALPAASGPAPGAASPCAGNALGLVRERAAHYQRSIIQQQQSKDNRYQDYPGRPTSASTSLGSTTSSEGYDEGLGEEKALKDRARSEKLLPGGLGPLLGMCSSSSSSAAGSCSSAGELSRAASSADEQEFGSQAGGEAMAEDCSALGLRQLRLEGQQPAAAGQQQQQQQQLPRQPCNTVTQTTSQHFRAISNAARSGQLPKSALRSVMLTIEDPAFAAVAATTTSLIDDETSPVDSLFDSPTGSVSHSTAELPGRGRAAGPSPGIPIAGQPEHRSGASLDDDSPGTPTNASNSLSLSEGREYFDDEIEDQPGLVFDETLKELSASAEHSQAHGPEHARANAGQVQSAENSPARARRVQRAGSLSTLSSCESLASDDLMMDYERSDASSFGDLNSRRANPHFAPQDLDDATSLLELDVQSEDAMKDWGSLLGQTQQALSNTANNNVNAGLNNNQTTESGLNNRTRLLHNRSSTDSPKSLESTRGRQVYSPLRTPRNVQSPSLDSGDEGSLKIERGTYNYMFQDIVSIKTMLLKLKRVLQETDTLNPFENSLKNGLLYSLNDSSATEEGSLNEGSVVEELADLRRQVVYLQGQVDEKDRTIQNLQAQLTKYQNHGGPGQPTEPSALLSNGTHQAREMLNAATQTDKLRPLSIGSSILQGLSEDNGTGSLVSSSDSWASSSTEQRQQSRLAGKEPSPSASSYCCSSISSGSSVSLGGAERPSPRRASRLRPPSSLQQQQQQQRQQSASPEAQARAPRKLAAPTLIPRAARAVSASGRTSTGSS